MSTDLRRCLLILCVLFVAGPILGASGCVRRALADEVTVRDDYATQLDVQGLSGEVNQLTGSVSALTGSVSGSVQGITDSIAVNSSKVDGIAETQLVQGETLDEVSKDSKAIQEGVTSLSGKVDAQSTKIDSVADGVKALGEQMSAEPEQTEDDVVSVDLEELLALTPEGASVEIVEYVRHPFIWGMAAGLVAYLISLAIAAVYRLLGLR